MKIQKSKVKMQNDNAKIQKKEFLTNEIATSAMSSAFQHAKIYKTSVSKEEKSELRKSIKAILKRYGEEYRKEIISEERHFKNIEKFADEVTNRHSQILYEGRLRIGIAQKALNLYVKYLWVLDWISGEPPHCPFDSGVIARLSVPNECKKWTKIDDIKCYKALVAAVRKLIESKGLNLSIAQWELEEWNKQNFEF